MAHIYVLPTVLVREGLRVHTINKVAHSSIAKAMGPQRKTAFVDVPGEGLRFMCVRHPCDRIVSAWAFFCKVDWEDQLYPELTKLGYYKGMPFKEFHRVCLAHHPKNIHTRKQIDFTGGFTMDWLCPLHNLNTHWELLREEFPFLLPLEHINPSPRESEWEGYFTNKMRAETENTFAKDVELYQRALDHDKTRIR